MKLLLPILALAALWQAPALAQTIEDDAVAAVRDICLPASETSVPARDFALQAGYADMPLPEFITEYFPAAAKASAYRAPAGAKVIVASAVMPAAPFSCVVFFLGDAPDMAARVKALRGAREGYALEDSPSSDDQETLSLDSAAKGRKDKILMLREKDGTAGFVVAYKASAETDALR